MPCPASQVVDCIPCKPIGMRKVDGIDIFRPGDLFVFRQADNARWMQLYGLPHPVLPEEKPGKSPRNPHPSTIYSYYDSAVLIFLLLQK